MAKAPKLRSYNSATNPEMEKLRLREDRVAFTDVTFRNFTLPANINTLQTFCDNYLNFSDDPDEITSGYYFKAASSNVTMSILNYGKMSTESENLGWIAQHEVLFSVPVECYKVDKAGELEFSDWTYVAPFIFVDNDRSLGVGREVYGWTKVKGWMESSTSAWTSDPRRPRRLVGMATELFPTLYAQDSEDARTLIEVVQDPPMSYFRSPFNTNDKFNPWWSASRNARRYLTAMNDAFRFASGLPIFGNSGTRRAATDMQMYSRLARNFSATIPWIRPGLDRIVAARQRSRENPANLYMNNLTLKQFRDAQEPDLACYQALVNSRISIESLSDGGLLGGSNLMMGDITGGYRIHVHEYEEQPIVDTLGLEVTETQCDEHGVSVAVLSPVLPTWMACDLRYDMGSTLCWRSKRSLWSQKTTSIPEARPDKRGNRFNTTRGAALLASVGPFHYPDATMRIFPLAANEARLEKFCDEIFEDLDLSDSKAGGFKKFIEEFERESAAIRAKDGKTAAADNKIHARVKRLNAHVKRLLSDSAEHDGSGNRNGSGEMQSLPRQMSLNNFQPYGSSIYMMLRVFGQEHGRMYSEHDNLGLSARRELMFLVPIIWSSWDEKAEEVKQRLVFLTPYFFCDSMRHALSESEVNGRPAVHCTLRGGDDRWLDDLNSGNGQRVLATLRTLLMPALDVGQPAEFLKLIEIVDGEEITGIADPENAEKDEIEKNQAKLSAVEKNRKAEKRHAEEEFIRETLGGKGSCIDILTLKQYRATGNIEDHCYQSIVFVRSRIEDVWDQEGGTDRSNQMHVYINPYPTMPIVKQLGIIVENVDSRGETIEQRIHPIRPWSVRVAVKEELGVNLYTRLYSGDWKRATEEIEINEPPPTHRVVRES